MNSIQKRKKGTPVPENKKDEAYWKKRKKNTEYAKKSRDKAKKLKIEQENIIKHLLQINQDLKNKIQKLELIIKNSKKQNQEIKIENNNLNLVSFDVSYLTF